MAILLGVIAFLGRVSLAKEDKVDGIALEPTSLLQVGTFHIEDKKEKENVFPSQPLGKDAWGRDAEEDAEDQSDDVTDSERDDDRDVDSEGISELQVASISSERGGQHAIQYPQASPTMFQSRGSTVMENAMPGTLRQAVVQRISEGAQATSQATPRAPVAGLVSMSTAATYENASGAAFSQLAALEAEFKELREDDSSHVKQLMYTVHLREQLRDQLRTAQEQLEKDNAHLAQRTSEILVSANHGEAAAGNQIQETDTESQPEEAPNTTVAAMLLQAAISSRQHREVNNQQIAAEALDRVQSLMRDIAALKQRDDQEMQALRTNANSREALQAKIDKRRQQLQTDAGALLVDLSQIRGLVQHESEIPGDLVAPDTQEGPQATSDAQVSSSGQQPIAISHEQLKTDQPLESFVQLNEKTMKLPQQPY